MDRAAARARPAARFPDKVTAFRPEMAVHGRFGKPCPVCGAPVQRIVYAENECNYCARCQTGGKLLADRSLSRLLQGELAALDRRARLERRGASAPRLPVDFLALLRMAMPSFDIISEVNQVEVRNALDQANKELSTRFDFKGSDARAELADKTLTLFADDEFKLKQVTDIVDGQAHEARRRHPRAQVRRRSRRSPATR